MKASLPFLSDTLEMGEREESRGEVSSNGDGVCVLTSTSVSMEAAAVVVVVWVSLPDISLMRVQDFLAALR